MPKRAVLLANLGSPDSTSTPDLRKYLNEFLGDDRVIDRPKFKPLRKLLVHGIIVPLRSPRSAKAYQEIWTDQGSPLVVTSKSVQKKLAATLATEAPVYLAMRYGNPSIASVITQMVSDGIEEVLMFPQYPHYAMSSWETVAVKIYEEAARLAPSMKITSVLPFYEDADYIEALYQVTAPYLTQPYDHLLFSYHGIPVRHLRESDASQAHCTIVGDCCNTCSAAHATCYKAQLTKTTQAFARRAQLDPAKWSISFQSRLVGEPWLSPYTDRKFEEFPHEGKKRIVVMTPAFVSDCLETLEEIAGEGKQEFLHAGGESFQHVPCLNDQPAYIDFLAGRVRRWLGGETPTKTGILQHAETLAQA